MKRVYVFVFALVWLTTATASIGDDLDDYFKKLGMNATVEEAGAYQGQVAGYYTGGSISTRANVHNLEIARIELPGYHAGCGGIDFFSGGFSFINAEEIKKFAKNVINNAVGYAFALGMDVVSPLVSNEMKYFMSMATKVNQFNLNSCETAQALVGGLWPKSTAAQRQICQDLATNKSMVTGWAQARQACGNGGQMGKLLGEAKKNPDYQARVLDNTNIAWAALRQNAFLQNDDELAELFMSLSGTIIITSHENTPEKDDANTGSPADKRSHEFKHFPSLARSQTLLTGLLEGGDVEIYRCSSLKNETDCLHLVKRKITIKKDKALFSTVKNLLDDMVTEIQMNKPITQKEKNFLNAVSLPVYKLLNVQTAFKGDKAVVSVRRYAKLIALDLLFRYLNDSLTVARQSASDLQLPQDMLAAYRADIDRVIDDIHASRRNAFQAVTQMMQMNLQTQQIERLLADRLSNKIFNSLEWVKGL